MDLYLFNSLGREKQIFNSINNGEVRMYSCGPTVYYNAHIGNLRAYLFMDNLRRVLKYNGYELKHVMNITDIGHMTSDADEGEDKMMKAARRENRSPWDIAKDYTEKFLKDIDRLHIERPEIIAKATEHIDCMEEYVKQIIENGYTYNTEQTVYFDTSKLKNYGILSGKVIDEQKAGARVELDSGKKNISDFALWIKAPKEHIMQWDSFFGKAYPGWHLECSAMGHKYLGEHFDIHTGGIDHIPIHHENEIAQAMGFCGQIPANYWIHVNFLTVDGNKMSKSLNNLYTVDELEKMGYEPLVYRMFNFSSSYRAQINFTFDAMDSAKIALDRLREGYLKHVNGSDDVSDEEINNLEEQFHKAINDDLNMPVAMSVVWNVIKNPVKSQKFKDLLLKFDQVLGFDLKNYTGKEQKEIPQEDLELVELRNQARNNKDWKESDRIRDILLSKGYSVKDTPEGTQIS